MKNISLKLMLFLCILGAMAIRAEQTGRQAGGVVVIKKNLSSKF
jgi:hypothetical protein